MGQVNENRMRLRIEYSRETDLIFSDNISAYADWLEKKLAMSQPLVAGRSEQLCRTFLSDGTTTSTTKCRFCGKEKWEH